MTTCTDWYLCRQDWTWMEPGEFNKHYWAAMSHGFMLPDDYGRPFLWVNGKRYRVRGSL